MTGDQLKNDLVGFFGEKFHDAVAKELKVDKTTIYRWISATEVPGVVAAWVKERKGRSHAVKRKQ